MYAGWDKHYGFQLYHSDPSGNYSGWKATCIGSNTSNATSILKQDYKEGLTLKEAQSLAIKVLTKTMDSTTLGSDKLEFAVISKPGDKVVYHPFSPEEIDDLLKQEKETITPAATKSKNLDANNYCLYFECMFEM